MAEHTPSPSPPGSGPRVAVVTGGGSGIGAASARRLSGDGAHVVVVDADGDSAGAVAASLPGPALAVHADVSTEKGVDAYVEAALTRFGRIDLHHLNAGVLGTLAPLPDVDAADFDHVIAVNLRGVFLGLRAAFRRYREQDSGGAVVVTASISSLRGADDQVPYQTSKHGVLGLVRGAAMYGGPRGVRVNAVAPGLIPTALFASSDDASRAKSMERRGGTVPMRRVGTPEEIAGVVAFLLGDDAAYVTGEVVSADGGAFIVNTVTRGGGAGAWTPDS
ncbi:NAD(P)-dependent dehydrogenase (short-subunit alcohol dehydrogenase family) [Nonomuraea fuscirosea]|uniref:NAD(P)-dependent dehydrogenase (Short-subunit alcohol dehydrogenase family) n=1 Tax=Nonomuraea fuscirosea TaxID=1291556 RepID=A0A2T0N5V1_9ACTN|nr:SDR family NAD(P)-dependent oxidoreductase [Nonomuraea fuscirosea]PRX67763.1 NAD(P)-dependent dehydrogenase (short-subunit alcohol dehydrogenase family) [Nonomuraea fuscirosea]